MKKNYFKQMAIGGRTEQQDNCDIFHNALSTFLVLADGMGGHIGGHIASETLVSVAKSAYKHIGNNHIDDVQEFFQSIIDKTQKEFKNISDADPKVDPNTTCVFALIQDEILHVGHIGDSRMYLFLDKKFTKRSNDHSVVQMLLNNGEITEEEMATHPDQNRLLKSVNGSSNVNITYKTYSIPKESTSAVLLCSDGLWEQVSTEEMQHHIFHVSIEDPALALTKLAQVRGGTEGDNISVLIYKQSPSNSAKPRKKKNVNIYIALAIVFIICLTLVLLLKPQLDQKPQVAKDVNKTFTRNTDEH